MPAPASSTGRVQFGVFELDLRNAELRKSGVKVKLQDQPLKILQTLLENPGQIVTREELRGRIWPANTFVEFDQGLYNAMGRLRDALGDSSDNPRFIETVARRGYRFIAPVTTVPTGPKPETFEVRPREQAGKAVTLRRLAAGVVAGLVGGALLLAIVLEFNVAGSREWLSHRTSPIRSLAVLPLENLSSDPEQEYFADGMTDLLITDLSKIGALRVISRTSVMPYKGARKPLSQIARELNVDAVLEGTVLRVGGRVRITGQLIRVSPEKHLWAETYDRDFLDVLALQEDVARDIARGIKIELTPQEQTRLSHARPINPEAQEDYLKGVYLWNKRSEPELEKSIEYLNQAIQKDPNYALAYAALADDYNALAIYAHVAPRESCPKSRAAALKALELDGTLGEAHAALGLYKGVYEWDQVGADAELRRAIELNPGDAMAHVWRGEGLCIMGRHVEALAELDRAREHDPTSVLVSDQRAWVLYMARRYDDAIRQLQNSLELEPGFAHAHCWLGKAYLQKGMLREGLAELKETVSLQGGDSPVFVPWLGYAYALSGRRGDALKVIERLENQEEKSYASPFGIAVVYCGLGEKTLALAWLEKAYQQRDPMMSMLTVEPAFDPLHSDVRFKDLIRRAGSPP